MELSKWIISRASSVNWCWLVPQKFCVLGQKKRIIGDYCRKRSRRFESPPFGTTQHIVCMVGSEGA
jgi:hypothetical protein